eukprot:COSAG02_NODE_36902_length_449_cov_0.700000_1_plen_73_part_01
MGLAYRFHDALHQHVHVLLERQVLLGEGRLVDLGGVAPLVILALLLVLVLLLVLLALRTRNAPAAPPSAPKSP